MSGLVVASDYSIGQQLVKDHDFKHNSAFFQAMFEIGRRHKIMNPEKMRSEYGKLLYILQDSNQPHVQELLEFSLVAPIKYEVFLIIYLPLYLSLSFCNIQ